MAHLRNPFKRDTFVVDVKLPTYFPSLVLIPVAHKIPCTVQCGVRPDCFMYSASANSGAVLLNSAAIGALRLPNTKDLKWYKNKIIAAF